MEKYCPQKHEWGTDAAADFAARWTPGQEPKNKKKDADKMSTYEKIRERVRPKASLTESHFKMGEKVRCKKSGSIGTISKIDPEEKGKYYTVKRADGQTMKYSPEELTSVQNEAMLTYFQKRAQLAEKKSSKEDRYDRSLRGGITYKIKLDSKEYQRLRKDDMRGKVPIQKFKQINGVTHIRSNNPQALAKYLETIADSGETSWSDILSTQQVSENKLAEKLDKDADAGDYVKDFYKSDAPQFKGKSKEKRRKMAIAAYLSRKEEVEKKRKDDPCWKGYKQVGMKKKNGKEVPNCVPNG